MRLPEFEYLAPKTISEACSMLAEFGGHAKLMGGGTDLLVSMKQRVKSPERVIWLNGVPDLRYIREDDHQVRIGASTLIRDLERSAAVRSLFPVLSDAARSLASPNLRNLATLGGNICLDTRCCYYNQSGAFRNTLGGCFKFGGDACHVVKKGKRCFAIFQADTVPALIALGAKLRIQSSEQEEIIPIEDLYLDEGKDYLGIKPQEMVTEVLIPNTGPHTGGSYQKIRARKSTEFAWASAAVHLIVKHGFCEDVRIVLGSVGSCPIRVVKAEDMLRGRKLTDDIIREVAEFAYKDAKPVDNIVNVSAVYRKEMARVLMILAAKEALSRAQARP